MLARIISGLILFAILVFTLWSANPLYFIALAVLAIGLGLHEFYLLADKVGLDCARAPAFGAAAAVLFGFYYTQFNAALATTVILAAVVALTIVALTLLLGRPAAFERSLATAAATVFGVVYVVLLAGFAIALKLIDTPASRLGSKLLGFFFLVIIASDTGAYFSGRALGRHKLAPKVSPGKTVEGSVGGLLLALTAAVLAKWLFFSELPWLHLIVLTAVIVVVGALGDLAESMLTRGAKTKDAASLIPGHGGLLDRLDSLLFNAPVIYYYYQLFLR